MNVHKCILVVVGLFLTMGSLCTINGPQRNNQTPCKAADGGAPLPPIPKGTGTLYIV